MTPVDLEAVARTGFDAHVGSCRLLGPADNRQVLLENGSPANVSGGPYSLGNDLGTGTRALLEEFPDQRLEGIQFAAARLADDRHRKRFVQVLPDGFAGYVKLTRDLPDRKLLFVAHPVDGFDCFGIHHHWFTPFGAIPL